MFKGISYMGHTRRGGQMRITEKEQSTRCDKSQNEKVNIIIDNLTLFDDDLMSKVFDENIEATKLLLCIILGRDDIEVLWVKGQEELKNPVIGGRTLRLDIRAVLGDGRQVDIEVQRNREGSHVKRARFHSSMLDSRMLRENQKFKELKDSYVIFICEHDKFGRGLPVYHVDRYIRETKELFEDGSHIIYVNGEYEGNDSIGQLMHDFKCKRADEIHYRELADGVRHFKETQEGRDTMCEAVRKFAEEWAQEIAEELAEKKAEELVEKKVEESKVEERIKIIEKLIKKKHISFEEAMEFIDIPEEERGNLRERLERI